MWGTGVVTAVTLSVACAPGLAPNAFADEATSTNATVAATQQVSFEAAVQTTAAATETSAAIESSNAADVASAAVAPEASTTASEETASAATDQQAATVATAPEAAAATEPAAAAAKAAAPAAAPAAPTPAPAAAPAPDATQKQITVGPSDSQTANFFSIQKAIDYIAGNGDYTNQGVADKDGWTITLEDGEYTRFKVDPSVTNLTVTGGKGAVINVLDKTADPTTKAAPDTGGINIQQAQGFTLKGVTVHCGGDTAWPHFAITNFGNAGHGNGLTVDDVAFTGTAGSAILVSSGMSDFSVTNCTFESGINTAINVMNDYTAVGTVNITGNTFNGNDFALHGYWGPSSDGSKGGKLNFTGNTVNGQDPAPDKNGKPGIRTKIVIQDSAGATGALDADTGAVDPNISGNTLNNTLVGFVNLSNDGVKATDVFASNTTNAGTFAVDGDEHQNQNTGAELNVYSNYVVNQGDYKYGKWAITGLDDPGWTDEEREIIQNAIDKANAEQSPNLNIQPLENGRFIHAFTWAKNCIYWTPYENGKLTISKTLEGNALESNDANDEFTFVITLTGKDIPAGEHYFSVQGIGEKITGEGMKFVDGVAKVTLKGGQSITIEGIPAGTTYTVKEEAFTDAEDKLTYTVKHGNAIDGTIEANKEMVADYTNSKQKDPEPVVPEQPATPEKPAPTPATYQPKHAAPAATPATGDNPATTGVAFATLGAAGLAALVAARKRSGVKRGAHARR